MKKFTIIFALLVTANLVSSCCSSCRISKSKQVQLLLESKWQLDELNSQSIEYNMPDSYTIEFDTKRGSVYGIGDCNRYFASFAIEGKSNISFSTIGSTKMICNNSGKEIEYFNTLKKVDGFIINEDELMLLQQGNVIAVLVRLEE